MDRKHFITVSLLVSALAFNPLLATELDLYNTSSQRQINTISGQVASLLFHRGLDEEVANTLSKELIEDNELFEAMLNNLLNHMTDLSTEEVFEYLSSVALHRQSIDLDSYDHLVHMFSKIKGRSLSRDELRDLSQVSKLNQMIAQVA